jgi:hypothetical protein
MEAKRKTAPARHETPGRAAGGAMVFKCANPDCTQGFDHRRGRVIRFHNDHGPGTLKKIRPAYAISGFAITAPGPMFSNIKLARVS